MHNKTKLSCYSAPNYISIINIVLVIVKNNIIRKNR